MRALVAALILVAGASFAQAGEIVTGNSQGKAVAVATTAAPVEADSKAAVTATPEAEAKSAKSLGYAGREGCGHSAEAKAPLLTQ